MTDAIEGAPAGTDRRAWKVVAVSDALMPEDYIRTGLAGSPLLSNDLSVLHWSHPDVAALQRDNLLIEQEGPDAVVLDEDLRHALAGAEVIITHFCPVGAELVEHSPHLRAVGVLRGGTENVWRSTPDTARIPVVNVPGRNANAVAEFAVGLILAATRRIGESVIKSRQGRWQPPAAGGRGVHELRGLSVGLVGAGRIGSRVSELLQPFGCRISYFDPHVSAVPGAKRCRSLHELLSTSDVVSLHARPTEGAKPLIDEDALASMRGSAVLVNTARSTLVDSEALVKAVASGRLGAAALDTFDVEPLPVDSPLRTVPDILVTHHLAGSSEEAFSGSVPQLARRLEELLCADAASCAPSRKEQE